MVATVNKHTMVAMIGKHTAVAMIYKRNGNHGIFWRTTNMYIYSVASTDRHTIKSLHHTNSFNIPAYGQPE